MGTLIGDYFAEQGQRQAPSRAGSSVLADPVQSKPQPKKNEKQRGRGGFITSLISEGGALGGAIQGGATGAALGSVVPGVGTAIGGLGGAILGAFGGGATGRLVENKVRDNRNPWEGGSAKEALKEGAISGLTAGPLKLAKAGAGAIKGAASGTGALEGANKAVATPILSKLTGQVGGRLTELGSGLKADRNVGGIANLEEQSGFMSKYVGTPRQQRVKMESDMKNLSTQVDDILTKTPVQVDGSLVGARLKAATEDLTDGRYIDLDLNHPSVAKIIDRYAEKFAKAQNAKGINDIVKTLNKTATRAQTKLLDPKAGVLTSQEQAALALKRAGDDVLSEVPEIAPLKKNMAQIFEATPQVAKAAEKGVPVPFAQGLQIKGPFQALKGAESYAGSRLQGQGAGELPGTTNFATRILAGRGVDNSLNSEIEPVPTETDQQSQEPSSPTTPSKPEESTGSGEYDPYASENLRASINQIREQGGNNADIKDFLAIAKSMNDLTATTAKPTKKTETQRARDDAAALTDQALEMLQKGSISTGLVGGNLEKIKGKFGVADPETIKFNTVASNLRATIAKARAGTAMSAGEKKLLDQYTPKVGDSGQELLVKLQLLKQTFNDAQQREYGQQYVPDEVNNVEMYQ